MPPAFSPYLYENTTDTTKLRSYLQSLLDGNAPLVRNAAGKLAKCLASALHNPGSLFRAELAFRSGGAYQLGEKRAEAIACSLEYFHLASLLFDDLPMMDDSMERRGQICTHLLFGEGTTVLSALALITRGYGLLGAAISSSLAEFQPGAHSLIERCLGSSGIINGQALDLEFHHETRKGMGPKQIAVRKTAPLIELALSLPATLSGASHTHLRKLRRLSICWGLLYQGLDDVSDALLSVERSGKTSGRDNALGRPNIFHQLGRVQTFRYLDRLIQVARDCIKNLQEQNERLEFLPPFLDRLVQRRCAFSET